MTESSATVRFDDIIYLESGSTQHLLYSCDVIYDLETFQDESLKRPEQGLFSWEKETSDNGISPHKNNLHTMRRTNIHSIPLSARY